MLGLEVERKVILGVFHSEASVKRDGQVEIAGFLTKRE